MKTSTISWKQVIRTLCALSLVLFSFAHRPVASVSQNSVSSIELASYVLPDGSGLAFCLSGDDGGEMGVDRPCEFCRIAGSVLLPTPSEDVASVALPIAVAFVVPVKTYRVCAGFPPAAPPRGPPVVGI